MVEEQVAVGEPFVLPRPKKRKDWPAYYEQNKEAISADYFSMPVRKFLWRWKLTTTSWPKLKEKWGVQSKGWGKTPGKHLEQKEPEHKEPRPKPSEFSILITEEDLAKLADDDFRLQWLILGRIIKNRLNKNPI